MRQISRYILEKLRINKNTENILGKPTAIQIANELFSHIRVNEDEFKKAVKAIQDWTQEIGFYEDLYKANIMIYGDNENDIKFWVNDKFFKKFYFEKRRILYFLKEKDNEIIYSYKNSHIQLIKNKKDLLFMVDQINGLSFDILIQYQPYGSLG